MKVSQITSYLESLAPLSSQESYDNSGLLVGDPNSEVDQVLISLDCTEDIINEAIQKKCQMIISHHPVIFRGLKKLNGKNYIERTILSAIKNDIVIYALHTNLDNYINGVNDEIAERLQLVNKQILRPVSGKLRKLVFYVPKEFKEKVMESLFLSGGGEIGNYSECSFSSEGEGTFAPQDQANPFEGKIGERSRVVEDRVEILFKEHTIGRGIKALKEAHPYEEVAFEVYEMMNINQYEGAGMIGELKEEMDSLDFLKLVKDQFTVGAVRYTKLCKNKIRKVAFCGGAGSFLLSDAIASDADIFITGDFKYHEFFDAEEKIIIADIGHYESEQFTSKRIQELLKKKFPTFAVRLTEVNTNPINYL